MSERIGGALLLIGFAALTFSLLLGTVWVVGTDDELYYALQTRAGVLDTSGVDAATLRTLDQALSNCLKGDSAALELEVVVFGELRSAFNAKEKSHMGDCLRLFALLKRALIVSAAVALIGIAAGCALRPTARGARFASRIAPIVVLAPLALFALWAVANFNAAFNAFHGVLFTNDDWLLDPRTDLLIRLCPASMFQNMGMRIGVATLSLSLLTPLATEILVRFRERNTA